MLSKGNISTGVKFMALGKDHEKMKKLISSLIDKGKIEY